MCVLCLLQFLESNYRNRADKVVVLLMIYGHIKVSLLMQMCIAMVIFFNYYRYKYIT